MPVDPCFAALLADKRNELRPPPPHITIDVMRAANKAFLVAVPKTPVHSIEDVSIDGPMGPLALRIYRPSAARDLPAILFCHGGGFVLGDLDSHDSMCQRLAHSAACVVVAVGYRCAPESTFPEPVEECHAALTWLVSQRRSPRRGRRPPRALRRQCRSEPRGRDRRTREITRARRAPPGFVLSNGRSGM